MAKFTFIDLFSGIGGFRLGLESIGGTCINFSEINKSAINTYCSNFTDSLSHNLGDITKLTTLPEHNILTAGVPCQSWSIAGKRLGFDDPRGLLWNNTIEVLNNSKPDSFIFENVKGLVDKRNQKEFNYIINRIQESGYFVHYFVLNSFDFGVPQNRERVYLVGFKNEEYFNKFNIPVPITNKVKLKDILFDTEVPNGFSNDVISLSDIRNGKSTIHSWDLFDTTDRQKYICELILKNRRKKIFGKLDGNPLSLSQINSLDETININELNELIELNILKHVELKYDFKYTLANLGINNVHRIYQPLSDCFSTLIASGTRDYVTTELLTNENIKNDFINKVYKTGKYRKLTKEETCQLQGFPVDYKLPEERLKWEKLLGNSVTVPVIKTIGQSIINTGIFN